MNATPKLRVGLLAAAVLALGSATAQIIVSTPAANASDPSRPDTTTGRLETARNELQSALAALSAVPTAAHGGFVEKAEEAVRLALAETVAGLGFVAAHPESNLLSRSGRDMTFTQVDAPRQPVYALYSVHISKGTGTFGTFVFNRQQGDPNVNEDLLRAYFHVHNSYYETSAKLIEPLAGGCV